MKLPIPPEITSSGTRSQDDFPHHQARWVRANSTYPHTVTESDCLEVVSPRADFFSMVLLSELGQCRKRHGLISPAWSSPVKANFRRGLCWMTMNLSFTTGRRLDGTGETLLKPFNMVKEKAPCRETRAWAKGFIPSSLAFRCSLHTERQGLFNKCKTK